MDIIRNSIGRPLSKKVTAADSDDYYEESDEEKAIAMASFDPSRGPIKLRTVKGKKIKPSRKVGKPKRSNTPQKKKRIVIEKI